MISSSPLKHLAEVSGRVGWHGLSTDDYLTEGEYLVTGTDLESGQVSWEACHRVSPQRWQQDPRIQLRNGDVLITKDGTIGKLALVGGQPGNATLNSGIFRVRPGESLSGRFLFWVFESRLFADFVDLLGQGSTISHLYERDIINFRVPLRPLGAQQIVADYLDAETARIDALIAKKQRMMELLRNHLEVSMTEVALGRQLGLALHESGVIWVGSIPEDWPVVRLNRVARLESGHTPARTNPDLWIDPDKPWITLNDVGELAASEFISTTKNLISDAGLAASSARMLPAGTVVLSRDATVGRVGIMAQSMATSQHFAAWVCSQQIEPRYLWLLLRFAMQPFLASFDDGATLRTIGMPHIKRFAVPLPAIETQKQLVDLAEKARRDVERLGQCLSHQVDLLRERRQALITAAVTGELDIPEVAA